MRQPFYTYLVLTANGVFYPSISKSLDIIQPLKLMDSFHSFPAAGCPLASLFQVKIPIHLCSSCLYPAILLSALCDQNVVFCPSGPGLQEGCPGWVRRVTGKHAIVHSIWASGAQLFPLEHAVCLFCSDSELGWRSYTAKPIFQHAEWAV